jgi:hypothetical protein
VAAPGGKLLNILVSSIELEFKLGRNKVRYRASLATESTLTLRNSDGVGKGKDSLIEMLLL